jgi:hypothetical protein
VGATGLWGCQAPPHPLWRVEIGAGYRGQVAGGGAHPVRAGVQGLLQGAAATVAWPALGARHPVRAGRLPSHGRGRADDGPPPRPQGQACVSGCGRLGGLC